MSKWANNLKAAWDKVTEKLPPLCAGDKTIEGIQKFIRGPEGKRCLDQALVLALIPRTASQVMTRYVEWGLEDAAPGAEKKTDDQLALEEVTTFLRKLTLIGFKKDPSQQEEVQEADISFKLFPNTKTVQLTGLKVTSAKLDAGITNVIAKDGACFAAETSLFANCVDVEIISCTPAAVLAAIAGPVVALSITESALDLKGLLTDVPKLTKLTRLEVLKCQWEAIPEEIGELAHLTALSVTGNSITDLSNLSKCTLLTSLDVSKNAIQSLDALLGEGSDAPLVSTLTSLNASENDIGSLGFVGPWLKSLKVLNLASCSVKDWAQVDHIAPLAQLTSVYLSNNPIYKQTGLETPARQMVVQVLQVAEPAQFVLDGVALTPEEVAIIRGEEHAEDAGSAAGSGAEEEAKAAAAAAAATLTAESGSTGHSPASQSPTSSRFGFDRLRAGSPSAKEKEDTQQNYEGWPEGVGQAAAKVLRPPQGAGQSCADPGPEGTLIVPLGGRVIRRAKRSPRGGGGPLSPTKRGAFSVTTAASGTQTAAVKTESKEAACSFTGALEAILQEQLVEKVLARLSSPQYKTARLKPSESLKTWLNGVVLCALLHDCNNRWVDYHNLTPSRQADNLATAIDVAEEKLSVPPPPDGAASIAADLAAHLLYTSMVLMAMQEYELRESSKTKHLGQRLLAEVQLYRSQRARDRAKILSMGGSGSHGDPLVDLISSSSSESDDGDSDEG
eukprot:TRINITY_DN2255_c0_g1_i1.p1 TRINITY_DN2255_c0_g1~~TRINITY_DN2255_c0_g1_i1.p1  ORF type:complete len:730 (+),score=308.80 TRINITY_DN2255_c0_g1_i1:99-2288(+)